MLKVLAAILIVLALIVIIVPQFNNCADDGRSLTLDNGKQVPMKCLWSARAELALGIPLLVLGILLLLARFKETIRSLSIVGVVLGILIILVPTNIIGVCMSADMSCNSILKPAMIVCGILAIVASLAAIVLNERKSVNDVRPAE